MTRDTVKQVIVITHGMGGQVMRALLAEVRPETDGSNSSGDEGQKPEVKADDYMSGIDDQKSPDAAKKAKEEGRPQFSIKPEPNPFGKDLELLKAIHVGVPQTGMPEIYAWFRAGMQTPVKSDNMSDMAAAYVTNQVLGANAAEITAVMSYSQCALEALPNNDYAKGWLCWQPLPFNLVEGEKPPALVPIILNENIYAEYRDDVEWYRLIDKRYLAGDASLIVFNYFEVKSIIDRTTSFHSDLNIKSTCSKVEKFIFGKSGKPSTRTKIVWQAQSQTLPNGDAKKWGFYWQDVASNNVLIKGINKLFDSSLFSKLVDSGEGSVYLSEKGVCSITPPH